MTMRLLASSLVTLAVVTLACVVRAEDRPEPVPAPESAAPAGDSSTKGEAAPGEKPADAPPEKPAKLVPGTTKEATFGGGCFWCTEAVFQRVPGVRMVVSGYSGGHVPFPTYEQVSTGTTGHAEVVEVFFDPALVSYEKLLEIFWRTHNPTTPNAQGPDSGPQYRSIILYHDDEQKKAAEKVYKSLKARRVLKGTVVTQLVPFQAFYPAEAYHQNYYNNHPLDPYSMVYIGPKFDIFRKLKNEMRKAAGKDNGKAAATK